MYKITDICPLSEQISSTKTARLGELKTRHGTFRTPAFMPVATKGYVKTVTPDDLINLGTDVLIANAFLLYLRPGLDIIVQAGGLHKFMNWTRGIFTDSGGFQMIRPDFHAKVTKQGITFQSPFDGTKHLITPEKCIEIQVGLSIDVAMVLDHCPEFGLNEDYIKVATEHTTEWAKRSNIKLQEIREISGKPVPLAFGIVQGGVNKNLREWSAKTITELGFDGYALGGLSIGEPKETMNKIIENLIPHLPNESPRYLMGVGSPEDILESIGLGVDIFDSVFPTRNARHGTIHTKLGNININRAPYSRQFKVIDENCNCSTCAGGFTRAYLNHLLKNYSILGMRLATIHNLHFIQNLLQTARERIKEGTYYEFKVEFLEMFKGKNEKDH